APVAIINNDDRLVAAFRGDIPGRVLTFGIQNEADYRATRIRYSPSETLFAVESGDMVVELSTHLVGQYNVSNVLGAIALGHSVGLSLASIRPGLDASGVVPGRLETVREGPPCLVMVDYAHTPDALERVLTNARNMTDKKLIVVFGCGGDRDPGKRPLMGKAAGVLADRVVVTNDNPRTEDPVKIGNHVMEGVSESGIDPTKVTPELDRRKAFEAAIEMASDGAVVLIAG